MNSHLFLTAALVGILATATSDLGVVIGARLGIGGKGPRRSGPDIIGRWFGSMLQGKFTHADILQSPRLHGELALGLAIHYFIGIVFTFAFGAILFVLHVAPTILAALLFGLATVVFPWFLMLPAMGMGRMGRGVPAPAQVGRMSLYTHLVFGLALGLWTMLLRPF